MKKFYKILIYILVLIVILWFVPIKKFINNNSINNKFYNGGDILLVCKYQATTGPIWNVIEFYGIENCPRHIDLIGSDIPELKLKKPIHEYRDLKFVFVGDFDKERKGICRLKKCVIYPVYNNINCLPYGFNLFQYNILDYKENELGEREKNIIEYHKNYERDNILWEWTARNKIEALQNEPLGDVHI